MSTCQAYLIASSSKKHTYPELDSGRTRLVKGLHSQKQQPNGDIRLCLALSPIVLYTISAALNNIGDLWDEFVQYTSGGRLSGMPPGDARWRCTESA